MLNFIKNNFFISPNKKTLNNYKVILEKVNNLENQIKSLTDKQIKNRMPEEFLFVFLVLWQSLIHHTLTPA